MESVTSWVTAEDARKKFARKFAMSSERKRKEDKPRHPDGRGAGQRRMDASGRRWRGRAGLPRPPLVLERLVELVHAHLLLPERRRTDGARHLPCRLEPGAAEAQGTAAAAARVTRRRLRPLRRLFGPATAAAVPAAVHARRRRSMSERRRWRGRGITRSYKNKQTNPRQTRSA